MHFCQCQITKQILVRVLYSFIFENNVLNKKVKSACVVSIFVAFFRGSSTFVMVRVCYQLWFVDGFVVFEPGKLFLKFKFQRKFQYLVKQAYSKHQESLKIDPSYQYGWYGVSIRCASLSALKLISQIIIPNLSLFFKS